MRETIERLRRRRPRARLALAAGAAFAAALAAAPATRAQDVKSAEEVSAIVAQAFGVEVLRIAPVDADGRPAYRVTVMNPGGDSDGAFQVTTLVVDAGTGGLIPQFRHKAAGYDLPGPPTNAPPTATDGTAIRRMTYR